MNSFDRYNAMLTGKACDMVPRVPILMQFAAEYVGSDYGVFAADFQTLVNANIQCARDFGFDQVSTISDPYRETHGFGSTVEYRADGPPRSTHPLADSKDLAILRQPDPLSSERMFDRVKAVRAFKEQVGGEFSILGWVEGPAAEAADLRGVIDFMMDMMDDEPFAGELMDRCLDVAIAFAAAQIEAGADTIGIGDAIVSQVSPDTYERLIQPRQKKLAQAIRAKGAVVKLHICGNITHLLPGISDVGVDIIDVDHMVDIVTVRETLGPRVVIAGNLDPVSAIKNGTPERIREELERVYAESGNPYFAMGGCEIPAATPPENLKALCHPLAYRN